MNFLASKLSEHPNFKWSPGMLAVRSGPSGRSGRVTALSTEPTFRGLFITRGDRDTLENLRSVPVANVSSVPDLLDPATSGALFQHVLDLEASATVTLLAKGAPEGEVVITLGEANFFGASLGEACARALLCLWSEKND